MSIIPNTQFHFDMLDYSAHTQKKYKFFFTTIDLVYKRILLDRMTVQNEMNQIMLITKCQTVSSGQYTHNMHLHQHGLCIDMFSQ